MGDYQIDNLHVCPGVLEHLNEPVREKTNNLPMRKQRRRSASR